MTKLTATTVRALRTPGKYADGHGLFLHVLEPERRYWMFRYQRDGRERVMSFGSADDISLADARKLHAKQRAILLAGNDPLAAREQAKQEQRQQERRFAEVADACITAHAPGWRCPIVARQWRQSLRDYVLPRLGKMRVGEIGTPDVLAVLQPIWTAKPTIAFKLRSRIEVILDYATSMGWRSRPNPALWRGGLKPLLAKPSKVHTKRHHAALDWKAAPAFLAELRARADGGIPGLALAFAMLTAARSGEVLGATWDEIDLEQRVWSIPGERMKMGKPHRVPLSTAAMELLQSLPRTESPFIFFGRLPGRGMNETTVRKMLRRHGHQVFTVHGMRACFRCWCSDTGKAADIAEAALAHTLGDATVQAYARSDMLDRRRVLMEAWASYLTKPPAEIVPLRAAG